MRRKERYLILFLKFDYILSIYSFLLLLATIMYIYKIDIILLLKEQCYSEVSFCISFVHVNYCEVIVICILSFTVKC